MIKQGLSIIVAQGRLREQIQQDQSESISAVKGCFIAAAAIEQGNERAPDVLDGFAFRIDASDHVLFQAGNFNQSFPVEDIQALFRQCEMK